MSYLFDASGERITGALASPVSYPCTLFGWTNMSSEPGFPALLNLGANSSAHNNSLMLAVGVDNAGGGSYDSSYVNAFADAVYSGSSRSGLWSPSAAIFTANNARAVYFVDTATTDTDSVSLTVSSGSLSYVAIGNTLTGTANFLSGFAAALAIWSVALNTTELGQLFSGLRPTHVRRSSLVDYWSLDTNNATQTGINGTALTVTGATWESDQPTLFDLGDIGRVSDFRRQPMLRGPF